MPRFLAGRIYLHHLYEQAAKNRHYDPILRYGSFYELIQTLSEKGIYTAKLLKKYSKEEIEHFGKLFNRNGINCLLIQQFTH